VETIKEAILRILVIIPCYNEDGSLKQTVESLKLNSPNIDFIVVNDGSLDNTLKICVDNYYPVINLPFNMGLTAAIQTGMRYAQKNSYDMALQYDGDGQHLSEYIAGMVELMKESSADIVIGSRYMLKTSLNVRGLGGKMLSAAVKISTGKRLSDPTSGMRLFNRKMIKKFACFMNFGPEPDTLAYLMNQGVTVYEMPVKMRERTTGKSYLNAVSAASYMLRMFISIIIIQWFRGKEGGY
jgi:glycosyltransferase involved in cell wall biosynthesis